MSAHDTAQLTHPKYRTDIDGLRAVAVLAVVGFHAFPGFISGGFVGVDIFFVISGFLISTIIFDSLRRDTFSFLEFYSRRIRRIFPALLFILAAIGGFGWFALFADEYKQLGKHIAAGAAFIFNFIVWNESGYFDSIADTKPLLHLWSLGIEEQFYILWPLILWLSWKRRFNLLAITAALSFISFALNVFIVGRDVTADFYSPQTRFWELSIGSALAYVSTFHQREIEDFARRSAHWQSVLGAVLLALGILFVTRESLFPGWWALLPTTGTALIISAGMRAWPNRVILSNRVLVWFGLISFPLYLWHWPLLSFARILEGHTPTIAARLIGVAIAVGLAWLTYVLIEKPFRFGDHAHAKAVVLLASMATVGAAGLWCFLNGGALGRIAIRPEAARVLFMRYPHEPFHNDGCDRMFSIFKTFSACLLSKPAPPDVLIIGDSHSNHFYKSLANRLKGNVVMNVAQWSCLPFSSQALQRQHDCGERIQTALTFIRTSTSIKTVYLAGYWNYLAAGGFGPEHEGWRLPRDLTELESSSFQRSAELMLAAIRESGKRAVVILDNPDLAFSPRSCVEVEGSPLIEYRTKDTSIIPGTCVMARKPFESRVAKFDTMLSQLLARFPEVKAYSPRDLFCDATLCRAIKDKAFLYYSCDHLTIQGADLVINDLLGKFPPVSN